MPRFKEGNFEKNVELVSKLKDLADKKNITPAQLALAWVHAQVRLHESTAAVASTSFESQQYFTSSAIRRNVSQSGFAPSNRV